MKAWVKNTPTARERSVIFAPGPFLGHRPHQCGRPNQAPSLLGIVHGPKAAQDAKIGIDSKVLSDLDITDAGRSSRSWS